MPDAAPSRSAGRRVVLVGAGHAHLLLLRDAAPLRAAGCDVTLVDPGAFWYSGRATAMLGGACDRADDTVDPAAVAAARGVRLVRDRLVGLDARARTIALAGGDALPYDALSLNLGSEVETDGIEGAGRAVPVKPIRGLWTLRRCVERALGRGGRVRAVVIGGGATGGEVAANLAVLGERRGAVVDVVLVSGGERLLPGAPAGAARALADALRVRGVTVRPGVRACAVEPGAALLADGTRLGADVVVLATGLRPPRGLAALGLPLAGDGGLHVDATLASVGDARVFAAGDCAHLDGHALPRLGVYGVRQAPVLAHNLLAALDGRPPRAYRPQRRALSILDLGRGEALAVRGGLWWRGRLAMRLKAWLDRRFLERVGET